jgi:hypothetical protein
LYYLDKQIQANLNQTGNLVFRKDVKYSERGGY